MSAVLELKNVTKKLGGKKVVDNVSFSVEKGEIFGFLGPNGAGKTTTIKMIVGLLSIGDGEILIDGLSLKKNFEKAMSMIGGIIENPEMYDYISGKKNLKMFGRMYGKISKERYDEIIGYVKLSNRINDKVKKYSLGMRQRLGVAQALLNNPKILILDEPTNGLDPAGIKELRDMFKELAVKEQLSVLVSSHLLSEMEMMCDRFAIIDKGVIIDIKSISDVHKTDTEKEAVYQFEVSNTQDALQVINGYLNPETPYKAEDISRLSVLPEVAAELNAKLVEAGIKVYAMSKSMHSLEDEFLKITANQNGQIH